MCGSGIALGFRVGELPGSAAASDEPALGWDCTWAASAAAAGFVTDWLPVDSGGYALSIVRNDGSVRQPEDRVMQRMRNRRRWFTARAPGLVRAERIEEG